MSERRRLANEVEYMLRMDESVETAVAWTNGDTISAEITLVDE